MPEAVAAATAQPIAPVNATGGTEAPASHQQKPAQPQVGKPTGKPQFTSKIEETLWRINEPTQDEVDDTKSMNEIIDKAQQAASQSSKEAPAVHAPAATEGEGAPTEPPKKERLKVGNQEYELDAEQQKRFAQKGILYEKRNIEIVKKERELQAKEADMANRQKQFDSLIAAIKQNGIGVVAELLGEEQARKQAEGWLRPKIEHEMLPEHERRVIDAENKVKFFEQELQKRQHAEKQAQITAQAKQAEQEYHRMICEGLEKGGLPKTEFIAKEFAEWFERGLDRGINYTPEQVAALVKEDNTLRVQAITGELVDRINESRKNNDHQGVVRHGKMLQELLGEPVMYAIGKYYVELNRSRQPQPKQILDTAKTKSVEANTRSGYMTEDAARAERMRRVALMEQGIDPGEWK